MVIPPTLSECTLTESSVDGSKRNEDECSQEYSYWEDAENDHGSEDDRFYVTCIQLPEEKVNAPLGRKSESFLSLPSIGSNVSLHDYGKQQEQPPVDSYLASIPSVRARSMALLQEEPVWYDENTKERLVYVRQGEVAHATSAQCDVLISDKATTCHILALYSTSSSSRDQNRPRLGSVAHIDGPTYDDCVRDMIQCHRDYHKEFHCDPWSLALDVHVMGGFRDEQGSSRDLTDWLLRTIAHVADDLGNEMTVTLRTAAVTSMNHSRCAPVGRGLALNLRDGTTFLAGCVGATGPDPVIRSLRFWSPDPHVKKLQVIHVPPRSTQDVDSEIRILPFRYSASLRTVDWLLSLPDDQLLRCTSTSPECEEADFCSSLRASLHYLRAIPYTQVFGPHANRVRVYRRAGNSPNDWIRQPDELVWQHVGKSSLNAVPSVHIHSRPAVTSTE
jgi:Protein N-terminal asparagine amidohydrolase